MQILVQMAGRVNIKVKMQVPLKHCGIITTVIGKIIFYLCILCVSPNYIFSQMQSCK